MSDNKTEEPTDKKIEDARKQGNVWKSKDLSAVAVFMIGLGVVKATWDTFQEKVNDIFFFSIDHISNPAELERATANAMIMGVIAVITLTAPIAFAAALAGGLVEFLQVGAMFSSEVLSPKLEKLNPIEGMKNLVGKKQLIELAKNMLKIGITAVIVWGVVRDALGMVVGTIRGDAQLTMAVMGELVYRVSVRVGLVFLLFAVIDVFLQHQQWKKGLMMSKDEVKREYKESEGDPHHKAKRKEMHQEIMEGGQMEAAQSADAVVTNPEHVAVAIKYDKEKDGAPRVIAKGIEGRAQALREIAKANDIPMIRNVPLAHALFRVEVNQEVPEELYDAVAEVLNFVYQMKQEQGTGLAQG